MKVIYVAGPYRGKNENEVYENIQHARKEALKLWQSGNAVICPHTNTAFMGSMLGCDDKRFMSGDLEILARCDGIYMLKGYEKSKGSIEELLLAESLELEVYYE